jgi:hypothetical protein
MAAVQELAPMGARGSLLSTYVTLCHGCLSVPVIIAGVAADHLGLAAVTVWYFVGLVLVVWAAAAVSHSARRKGA